MMMAIIVIDIKIAESFLENRFRSFLMLLSFLGLTTVVSQKVIPGTKLL